MREPARPSASSSGASVTKSMRRSDNVTLTLGPASAAPASGFESRYSPAGAASRSFVRTSSGAGAASICPCPARKSPKRRHSAGSM